MKNYKKSIILETTNVCNLSCPACPCHNNMTRARMIMQPTEFDCIFSKIKDNASSICFYMMGEPLLNPHLFQYIKIVHDAGIRTVLSTNAMLLDEYIDEIFESGIDYIQIALDGIDKETHESYRIGSSFNKVMNNIIKLTQEKEKRNYTNPQIGIQTIVNKFNEDSISEISKFAEDNNLLFNTKKMTFGKTHEIIYDNQIRFEPQKVEYRRFTNESLFYSKLDNCPELEKNIVILCNGDVVPCCYDYNGVNVFGNLLCNSLEDIFDSEKLHSFIEDKKRNKSQLCMSCDLIVQ